MVIHTQLYVFNTLNVFALLQITDYFLLVTLVTTNCIHLGKYHTMPTTGKFRTVLFLQLNSIKLEIPENTASWLALKLIIIFTDWHQYILLS